MSEIEELKERIRQLESALKPFAGAYAELGEYRTGALFWEVDGGGFEEFVSIGAAELRDAAKALNELKHD